MKNAGQTLLFAQRSYNLPSPSDLLKTKSQQKHICPQIRYIFNQSALPDPDKCLGVMMGQYVRTVKGNDSRPYIPISRIDQPGIVDFFVRDLRGINNGADQKKSFTYQLLDLQVKLS